MICHSTYAVSNFAAMPESRGGGCHQKSMPSFEKIVSLEELFRAWRAFSCGKKNKPDVAEYAFRITTNLHSLHEDLTKGTYRHGTYFHFRVNDSKPRDIHKASVRDRIVHHAIYQALYPYFDKRFIHDSYSCRVDKGTHRALRRFEQLAREEGRNHTRTTWVLKCDIRKCFASINHAILKNLLEKHVRDLRLRNERTRSIRQTRIVRAILYPIR